MPLITRTWISTTRQERSSMPRTLDFRNLELRPLSSSRCDARIGTHTLGGSFGYRLLRRWQVLKEPLGSTGPNSVANFRKGDLVRPPQLSTIDPNWRSQLFAPAFRLHHGSRFLLSTKRQAGCFPCDGLSWRVRQPSSGRRVLNPRVSQRCIRD